MKEPFPQRQIRGKLSAIKYPRIAIPIVRALSVLFLFSVMSTLGREENVHELPSPPIMPCGPSNLRMANARMLSKAKNEQLMIYHRVIIYT